MTCFNTKRYEASHARKPRGFGGWAFEVDIREQDSRTVRTVTSTHFAPCGMTYGDAKKWVLRIAGRDVIEVRPMP